MTLRTVVKILLIIGLIYAVAEGLPQKGWTWFSHSEVGSFFYSLSGGEQHLSGLLRGPLDSFGGSNLTNSGIVTWTNTQREAQGLAPLHENAQLRRAAEAKVDDMFAKQYFEHESPDGKSPADVIRAAGYSYIVVGENLALGNFKNDQTLVQAWMDSPGHRANILNGKFQEIGVAAKKGMFEGKEVWLAVQEFGAPLSSCPAPTSGMKSHIDSNRGQLASNQAELARQKAAIDANRFENEEQYNRAVEKYNALVNQTNALAEATQDSVRLYNDSVNAFNSCLESNT